MSSIAITGGATGTGVFSLLAPSTSTNRTLTLPDSTGTVVVSGTSPSFNGIQFPATQSASADANTLDDYEEGTWTPVVAGGSTAGTASYGLQEGTYTKIGNMVIANCYVTWSSATGTGDFTITGLPFASSASYTVQAGSVYANEFNGGTSVTSLIAFPNAGSTTIIFRGFVNNATRTVPAMDAAGSIAVTVTYRI